MLQILSLLIKIVHLQDDAFDDGLRYSQINTQTFIDAEREQNETDYPNISFLTLTLTLTFLTCYDAFLLQSFLYRPFSLRDFAVTSQSQPFHGSPKMLKCVKDEKIQNENPK